MQVVRRREPDGAAGAHRRLQLHHRQGSPERPRGRGPPAAPPRPHTPDQEPVSVQRRAEVGRRRPRPHRRELRQARLQGRQRRAELSGIADNDWLRLRTGK